MVNKEEKYDRIDRYLRGELRGQELTAFQSLLDADPNFAGEVDLHRQVMEAIADVKSRELERVIEEVGREFDRESRSTRVRRFFAAAAAATGLLLASVATIYMLYGSGPSPQMLAANNFEPYGLYSNVRSGAATETGADKGFDAYAAQDYAEAIALFEAVRNAGNGTPEVTFFLANAYLTQGLYGKAEPLLQSLAESSGHLLTEQSEWYLALALLGQQQTDAAKALLREIAIGEHAYAAQATTMLQQLSEE